MQTRTPYRDKDQVTADKDIGSGHSVTAHKLGYGRVTADKGRVVDNTQVVK